MYQSQVDKFSIANFFAKSKFAFETLNDEINNTNKENFEVEHQG